MGCDIHMHIEVQIAGKWEHFSAPDIRRHYALFGKLAGVRNQDIKPISEPRGLPEKPSAITWLDLRYWASDGHTYSWLTGAELEEVDRWMFKNHDTFGVFGYLFGNGWDLETNGGARELGIEDVRAIFWFDN